MRRWIPTSTDTTESREEMPDSVSGRFNAIIAAAKVDCAKTSDVHGKASTFMFRRTHGLLVRRPASRSFEQQGTGRRRSPADTARPGGGRGSRPSARLKWDGDCSPRTIQRPWYSFGFDSRTRRRRATLLCPLLSSMSISVIMPTSMPVVALVVGIHTWLLHQKCDQLE